MAKSDLQIEMQPVPIQETLGYSGNEEIDRIAREMRENADFQSRAQAIIDRHYNAMYYQIPREKNSRISEINDPMCLHQADDYKIGD